LSDRKFKPPPPDPFRHQNSAIARGSLALASLNLTRRDILPTLTATLTTIAFDDSSLQWLEIST
jgi:hypothetical protein